MNILITDNRMIYKSILFTDANAILLPTFPIIPCCKINVTRGC